MNSPHDIRNTNWLILGVRASEIAWASESLSIWRCLKDALKISNCCFQHICAVKQTCLTIFDGRNSSKRNTMEVKNTLRNSFPRIRYTTILIRVDEVPSLFVSMIIIRCSWYAFYHQKWEDNWSHLTLHARFLPFSLLLRILHSSYRH